MTTSKRTLSGIFLSVIMILSIVGGAVTFTGSVAAANEPTAELTSVGESLVNGSETVTVKYTASDDGSVDSATVQFLNDGSVAKGVSVSPSNSEADVAVPTTNGTYSVQLVVTDNDGNTVPSDNVEEIAVDTKAPEIGITEPSEDSDETSPPTIVTKVDDNVGVKDVEVKLRDEKNDFTYNGSEWTSSVSWVDATERGDSWEYETPDGNGTYTVVARASDTVGNDANSELDSSVEFPGDGKVTYTVDPNSPDFNNVSVSVSGPDRIVQVGDDVTVTADVTDATSGIGSVTVDATSLGESETLSLTNDDGVGSVWNKTFTVDKINVPDGRHSLTVNATDEFGLWETLSSSDFTLDTQPNAIGNINVEAGFIGIVEDEKVRVTAENIVDANGNPIDVGTVNISIAGQTPFEPASVSDGSFDTTIDPTKLDNSLSVADPVEVDIAGTGATNGTVELTHEIRALDSGWHVGGTPMAATDVYISGDGTVMTYDKTAAGNWTQVTDAESYLSQPGAGYYFDIISEEARIGYTFDETSSEKAWTLTKGKNLVGAVTDIDGQASATLGDADTTLGSLKGYVAKENGANLKYHIRKDTDGTPLDELVGTKVVTANSKTVLGYSSYIIEVETEGGKPVTYTVGLSGYDPTEKPN
ncbi:surface glycoprotein [Salinibaculum rarum]|uniref:surface glycoprotein n=1 Tax=Salinibaculum rarum TaxID=3058903 RepID=UPI00265D8E4F|nr:surface glycoprotein [Salinibaculum sp. KK48]